jgi:long-subunit acyl-CoA synthetase (AMP-forming)
MLPTSHVHTTSVTYTHARLFPVCLPVCMEQTFCMEFTRYTSIVSTHNISPPILTYRVNFQDNLKLMDDLAVLRPTVFASVPRLYNRIYAAYYNYSTNLLILCSMFSINT